MNLLILLNPNLSDPNRISKLCSQVLAFVAMSILLLSGCVDENRQKIVGSWTMIKADKLSQRVNVAPTPESSETKSDNPASGAAATATELPAMTLDFRNSGQLVTTTKLGKIDSAKTGRWRMVKFDPPSAMTIECFLDQQSRQSRQLEVTWVDDQTIRLTPPNMSGQRMKLNFRKQ